jgi:hypothetical protein
MLGILAVIVIVVVTALAMAGGEGPGPSSAANFLKWLLIIVGAALLLLLGFCAIVFSNLH